MFKNENVFVMDHPLIQHKLTYLRDKRTGSKQFRELVSEIAMLMCYEATRDLPLKEITTETPMMTARKIKQKGFSGIIGVVRGGNVIGGHLFKASVAQASGAKLCAFARLALALAIHLKNG